MSLPYLEGLNDPQKEAVTTTEGPLLVLAGAGSGKTRVITHRIVHLIHQGVAPYNILAVTFTNKAAGEMRERVQALINAYAGSRAADGHPTVVTFHALCVRLLREYHQLLNLPKHFTIYDRADSIRAIKQATEAAGYDPKQYEPRRTLSIISRAKGDALTAPEFAESAKRPPEQMAAVVWEQYNAIMRQEGALDFDDLLVRTRALLQHHPEVLNTIQNRYHYLHIDEYQDTNKIQYEIARLIAGTRQNICVVGDIDQNIYSWRGADIKNVLQFERHFPGAKTILLEENYRSTQTIIAASNDIINKNQNRIEKNVFTNNQEGELITLFAAMTGGYEASYIAKTAKEIVAQGARPSDIAVLFRTNFQSRALEEAFLAQEIPYQVLGTKFFERKEVKDVLSYLRLALNPDSTGDLTRIINTPTRGIGKVTVLKLLEGKRADLTPAIAGKVDRFFETMQNITDCVHTKPLSETLKFIISHSGLEADYKKNGTEDDLARLENLRELVTMAIRYDQLDPSEAVEAFLETAALQSDQDELEDKENRDAVRLMTIHAAKGLEFPYVFITGMEEGLFPHERLDERRVDDEEERRLFYVALTRAQKKVYLTYAHLRTIFGSQRVNVPSSFLNDIDGAYVEIDGKDNGWGSGSGYETTVFLD